LIVFGIKVGMSGLCINRYWPPIIGRPIIGYCLIGASLVTSLYWNRRHKYVTTYNNCASTVGQTPGTCHCA